MPLIKKMNFIFDIGMSRGKNQSSFVFILLFQLHNNKHFDKISDERLYHRNREAFLHLKGDQNETYTFPLYLITSHYLISKYVTNFSKKYENLRLVKKMLGV